MQDIQCTRPRGSSATVFSLTLINETFFQNYLPDTDAEHGTLILDACCSVHVWAGAQCHVTGGENVGGSALLWASGTVLKEERRGNANGPEVMQAATQESALSV